MMDADAARQMMAENEKSLAALEVIAARMKDPEVYRRAAIYREIVEDQRLNCSFSKGGTIWGRGADTMTDDKICDTICEITYRHMLASVRRVFEKRYGR